MVSLDLPVRSAFETIVTLYQRAPQRFHVLIDVPDSAANLTDQLDQSVSTQAKSPDTNQPSPAIQAGRSPSPAIGSQNRLLWLEISPTRAIFTSQSKTGLSYRHLWECGTYGISRYWLNPSSPALTDDLVNNDLANTHDASDVSQAVNSGEHSVALRMRLRNFTRSFVLTGRDYPDHLRLEYELWSQQLQLGTYVLDLDIHR